MKQALIFSSIIALFVFGTISKGLAQHDPAVNESVTEMYSYIIGFEEDYGSLRRFYAIENSPERRERFRIFFSDCLSRLDQLPFDQFSTGAKVDYLLTRRFIENELVEIAIEAKEFEALVRWMDKGFLIYELEQERRRGKRLDARKVAEQLSSISHDLSEISNKLEKDKVTFSKKLTERADGILQGQREALKSVFEFYDGYDPQFSWWVGKTYEITDSLLRDYAKSFKTHVDSSTFSKDDGSGIVGNPIGREELIRQLKNELIPYSPEKLVEIATKEFAWCDLELLKVSREMGYGEDWRAAHEKVKESFVEEGDQPQAMLKLYNESVAFLKDHDLITIPPLAEETWRMKMISPERQLISPFFLGGEVLQIAYPTDAMSHEDKLMSFRGNNPHFARAVVHHELIAGHHLQQFMNRRHKPYRHYYTPFWTEGWALYWELLLWDLGFPQSPEDKVGMLFWRKHRCARIIFSLNYHLEKWTPQQCIDYLVDRVGHERANAEGEVRRSFTGGYGPLYQIAYMIGGLQFYELKKELVDSGLMSYRGFHDAVMHENNMPVEMVRAILMNQDLDRDHKTSWKFYEK